MEYINSTKGFLFNRCNNNKGLSGPQLLNILYLQIFGSKT
jgi:hypothetical protein